MKTIKILLSVAGFALITVCFGQLLSQNNVEPPIMTSTFFVPMESEMVIESWMCAPFETNEYEEELEIESWMISPFESCYYEEEIEIEAWMTIAWTQDP